MELNEALVRVIDACNEAELQYGLAGGFAFALYCEPRMSYPLVNVHRLLLIDAEQEFILDILRPNAKELAGEFGSRLQRVSFAGRDTPVVSPELLWLLKRSSTRAQDQLDADQLYAVLNTEIAASLAQQFGVRPG